MRAWRRFHGCWQQLLLICSLPAYLMLTFRKFERMLLLEALGLYQRYPVSRSRVLYPCSRGYLSHDPRHLSRR